MEFSAKSVYRYVCSKAMATVKNYENRSKNDEVTIRNAIAYCFGPPCILETIIAFTLVLITCVYVLGLTVLNSGRAACI